jgi:hypothetical protein
MTDKSYEDAAYYDCLGSERLEWETPEEAIVAQFECCLIDGATIDAEIKEAGPIIVTAYKRQSVGDDWIERMLTRVAEDVEERWDEDFGDPEGDADNFAEEARELFKKELKPVLARLIEKADVWACDTCATREYSPEEVRVILKDSCPQWWDEET